MATKGHALKRVRVYLEDADFPIVFDVPAAASVLMLKRHLHGKHYTPAPPRHQHILLREDAAELSDAQLLSEVDPVSDSLTLEMTAKVDVAVLFFDSSDSPLGFLHLSDVDAGATTVLALKKRVVAEVDEGVVSIGPEDVKAGRVHLRRSLDEYNSDPLEDHHILAHLGVGTNGQQELFYCVVDCVDPVDSIGQPDQPMDHPRQTAA